MQRLKGVMLLRPCGVRDPQTIPAVLGTSRDAPTDAQGIVCCWEWNKDRYMLGLHCHHYTVSWPNTLITFKPAIVMMTGR